MIQPDSPPRVTGALSSSSASAPITEAQLQLKRAEERTNCLSISFFPSQSEGGSDSVNVYLEPLADSAGAHVTAIFQELFLSESFQIADVYPLNGVVKRRGFKITDYLRPIHRTEILQMIERLDERDPDKKWARCLVVDLKDSSGRYDNVDEIINTQRAFAAFFQKEGSKRKGVQSEIHKLISSNRINFIINEGSLKADLIRKAFTSEQAAFFQETRKGPELFCQLCEVIMNSFKQGYRAVVHGESFNPDNYITPIHPPFIEKIEASEGKIIPIPRLMTFYPHHYREIYADVSEYFLLIATIFKANHYYENTTTIITIE